MQRGISTSLVQMHASITGSPEIKQYIDNSVEKCHYFLSRVRKQSHLFVLERKVAVSLGHACTLCGAFELITASVFPQLLVDGLCSRML